MPECPYISQRHDTADVDIHVGGRVRAIRERRGMSRETLSHALNVSYQQFQKYETGQNRISAGRLPKIARLLGVQIADFFDGLQQSALPESVNAVAVASPATRTLVLSTDCIAFLELFVRIKKADARKSISELVLSLAGDDKTGV